MLDKISCHDKKMCDLNAKYWLYLLTVPGFWLIGILAFLLTNSISRLTAIHSWIFGPLIVGMILFGVTLAIMVTIWLLGKNFAPEKSEETETLL